VVVVVGVAAQPCRIVTAMIAASNLNEKIVVFIGWILSFSRLVNSAIAGLKGLKTATGRSVLRPIQIRLTASSLAKTSPACQTNSPQARIANSSSRKAVNFSSARTTKRFPSSRCASAIQIVRPLESIADRNRAGSRLLFLTEFFKTRIAAQRIPVRVQTQPTIG
jgi:hypothetical protein